VRGHRVELGEIEVTLERHPHVARAVAVLRRVPPGEPQLVAYVVPRPPTAPVHVTAIRDYLAERLPAYMLPTAIVPLQSLPLTPNGKVDRAALPPPESAVTQPPAPGPGLEQEIAHMFAKELGRATVGADDNFFDLGGHSVGAMRLLGRIRTRLAPDFPVNALFEQPTVGGVLEWMRRAGMSPVTPPTEPRAHSAAEASSGSR
jgi:hypothetical protein